MNIFTAIQNGALDVVQALLDNGADVNQVDDDGETLLGLAASEGHSIHYE